MTSHLSTLDWTYIRAFLAVAETGSLSAAARKTGQSQPTIGRHIKAAEDALGATLFIRETGGFRLTDTGATLLGPATDMAKAAATFETLAVGQDQRLFGTVRITASMVVSHFILPDIIADLRQAEPDIDIELVPSDAPENLLFREADIAVRMFRPTQLDIIARKVADQNMALYCTHDLIERWGNPTTLDQLSKMPLVGFDRSDLIIRHMRDFGVDVAKEDFGVRCDDQAAFWNLICAGCGVGAMQTVIGDADPRVQRIGMEIELPSLPLWLAAHEAVYKTPRIKRVWDVMAQRLGAAPN